MPRALYFLYFTTAIFVLIATFILLFIYFAVKNNNYMACICGKTILFTFVKELHPYSSAIYNLAGHYFQACICVY